MIKTFQNFFKERSGSIAITFALLLLPLLTAVGAAIDYSHTTKVKSQLQNAADAALIAATVDLQDVEDLTKVEEIEKIAKETASDFMEANTANIRNADYEIYDVSFDPVTNRLEVVINYKHPTFMMKIAGHDELEGSVSAATTFEKDTVAPFSMYLVLDQSGSMRSQVCMSYNDHGKCVRTQSRIDALKSAVVDLTNTLNIADPEEKYIRTAMYSYHSNISSHARLDWGSAHVAKAVSRLRAGGGTMAQRAISNASRNLTKKDSEDKIHKKEHGKTPTKFIVYMSDGADWQAHLVRNRCKQARNKGVVIYTVIFGTDKRAKELLEYCASSDTHFFQATTSKELSKAFQTIGNAAAKSLLLAM